ncbi:MAG: hypothetical protein JWP36_2513, partial [Paucimonas sp.]|nr:hypothetical protein [Paucimonas sp.]
PAFVMEYVSKDTRYYREASLHGVVVMVKLADVLVPAVIPAPEGMVNLAPT